MIKKKKQQRMEDVTQDGGKRSRDRRRDRWLWGEVEGKKKKAVECRDGESVLIKTLNLTRRRRADESEINPLIASRLRRRSRSGSSRRESRRET